MAGNTIVSINTVGLGIAWELGQTYRVAVDEGFVSQEAASRLPIGSATSLLSFITPFFPPQISNTYPATNTVADKNIENITFTIDRKLLTTLGGNVFLYRESGNVLTKTYNISNAAVSGNVVTLSIVGNVSANTIYYVTANANIFLDRDGFKNNAVSNTSTFRFTTPIVPQLISITPANAAIIPRSVSTLAFTVDRDVTANSGNIYLYSNTGALVNRYVIGSNVTVSNSNISLSVAPGLLEQLSSYYITTDANIIQDKTLLKYPGITNSNVWTFTTNVAPKILGQYPGYQSDGTIGTVSSETDTSVVFYTDRLVTKNVGNIYLYKVDTVNGNSLVYTYNIADTPLTNSQNVFLDIQNKLKVMESYYVLTDPDILHDSEGAGDFRGITLSNVFTFTTSVNRTYDQNRYALMFGTNDVPAITEADTGAAYQINLQFASNIGVIQNFSDYFSTRVGWTASTNTYSYSGTLNQVNSTLGNIYFFPYEDGNTSANVTYTQYKNSDFQKTQSFKLIGISQNVIVGGTTTSTVDPILSTVITAGPEFYTHWTSNVSVTATTLDNPNGNLVTFGNLSKSGWSGNSYSLTGNFQSQLATSITSNVSAISYIVTGLNRVDDPIRNFTLQYKINKNGSLISTVHKSVEINYINGILNDANLDTVYFTEDIARSFNSNLIVVGDTSSITFSVSLIKSNNQVGTFSSSGSGGTSTYASNILTISGTRNEVNSHLANITYTPAGDFANGFVITYSVTNTSNSISANATQSISCNSTNNEITNMNLDRSYTVNAISNIFSSTIPYISDVDNGDTYNIKLILGSSIGFITHSDDWQTKPNWTSANLTYSYTGTLTNCNEKFASLKFYVNKDTITSTTITYEQRKNNSLQVSQQFAFTGQVNTVGIVGTALYTFSTVGNYNYLPTWEQYTYLSCDALIVGGGGSPGGYFDLIPFIWRFYGGGGGAGATNIYYNIAKSTDMSLTVGGINQASNVTGSYISQAGGVGQTAGPKVAGKGGTSASGYPGGGGTNDSGTNFQWIFASGGGGQSGAGQDRHLGGNGGPGYETDFTGVSVNYSQGQPGRQNAEQYVRVPGYTGTSPTMADTGGVYAPNDSNRFVIGNQRYPDPTTPGSGNQPGLVALKFREGTGGLPGNQFSLSFPGTAYSALTGNWGGLQTGTGNFTFECWVYSTDVGTSQRPIFDTRKFSGSNNGWMLRQNGTDSWLFLVSGGNNTLFTVGGRINNVWQHIALVRNGDTVKFYVNGTLVVTSAGMGTVNYSDNFWRLGGFTDNLASTGVFKGFIDEVKFSNTARYFSSFSTPNESFVSDSNTLLLLQGSSPNNSGTFTDKSGYNRSITRGGTVNVSGGATGVGEVINTNIQYKF